MGLETNAQQNTVAVVALILWKAIFQKLICFDFCHEFVAKPIEDFQAAIQVGILPDVKIGASRDILEWDHGEDGEHGYGNLARERRHIHSTLLQSGQSFGSENV